MLKTPVEICTEKISALVQARPELSASKENIAAWIAANEKLLSVEGETVLHKGRQITSGYIATQNLFYDFPRKPIERTQRQYDAEKAMGIMHHHGQVRIVPDPDDDVPADRADFSEDRAVLMIQGELRARGLPCDDVSARRFLSINRDKLNFAPSGDLRIGNRPLSAEMSLTPSLLKEFQTPKMKMPLSVYKKLHAAGKLPSDMSRIELIEEPY